ncbi:hypothetical protein QTN25_008245 [Entamoeba marina]
MQLLLLLPFIVIVVLLGIALVTSFICCSDTESLNNENNKVTELGPDDDPVAELTQRFAELSLNPKPKDK